MATASELFEARHYPGVVALITDALEGEPECVPLLLVRARAHMALRRDLDAQADLRDIIRLDPQCSLAYRLLGELAARRDENESAAIFFSEALRLDPGDHEADTWLAIVQATARPAAVAKKLPAPAAAAGRFPASRESQPRFAKGTRSPDEERPTARRAAVVLPAPAPAAYPRAIEPERSRRIARPDSQTSPELPPGANDRTSPFDRSKPLEPTVPEVQFGRSQQLDRPPVVQVQFGPSQTIDRTASFERPQQLERTVPEVQFGRSQQLDRAPAAQPVRPQPVGRPVARPVARIAPDVMTDREIEALPPPPAVPHTRVATGSSPLLEPYEATEDDDARTTYEAKAYQEPPALKPKPTTAAYHARELSAYREPQPAFARNDDARSPDELRTLQGAQPVRRPLAQASGARHASEPNSGRAPSQPPVRGPVPELPGFGDYLVATGILTRERLRAAQAYQRSMKVQLATAIVTLGLATPQRIEWAAVAHQSQISRGG